MIVAQPITWLKFLTFSAGAHTRKYYEKDALKDSITLYKNKTIAISYSKLASVSENDPTKVYLRDY